MKRTVIAVLVAALAVAVVGTASASTSGTPYRTEKKAEGYVSHLRYWRGVNVGSDSYRLAFCFGSPILLERFNSKGENVYRRFNCMLSSNGRTFHMKVWTRRHGWRARPGQFSD